MVYFGPSNFSISCKPPDDVLSAFRVLGFSKHDFLTELATLDAAEMDSVWLHHLPRKLGKLRLRFYC
jgi:hypothetical protein